MSDKKQAIGDSVYVGYKKLIAWQLADKLAWGVYSLTDSFPKDEIYGLTSQLRRAILSVALNIVEGFSRNNKNEFRHFLNISLGSLAESDYLLQFSLKRKYLDGVEFKKVDNLRVETGKVLWSLMKSL
jgi:four helix bundle protein